MKRNILGFIGAAGFVYLVASQTQIGWLYLIDGILFSLLLFSAIIPWYSLRSLQLQREVVMTAASFRSSQLGGPLEGETVEVRLKVANNGRLPRYFIRFLEDCPFEQPEQRHRVFLITRLKAGATTAFSYTANCYRRGRYESSTATLECSAPLGLVVRRRTFLLPLNLTVYPSYYHLEGLSAAEATWGDWGHAVKSRAAAEFYTSREYQHGDPLRHIHWRNTAKLGHFMIKEFEQAAPGSLAVAFEVSRDYGTGKETTLEYSVKIAASLARLAADSGRGIDIIAGETPRHNTGWRPAMEYLARLEPGKTTAWPELRRVPAHQIIVAIVPALEPELASVLSHLAPARQVLVVLLEGFTSDETPNRYLSGPAGSTFPVISCPRGGLETAIKKLGDHLLRADKLGTAVG